MTKRIQEQIGILALRAECADAERPESRWLQKHYNVEFPKPQVYLVEPGAVPPRAIERFPNLPQLLEKISTARLLSAFSSC